jgi:hypothetical protein
MEGGKKMTDSFASRLRAYLHAEKSRLGTQTLTAEQWEKAVNAYHSADQATTRMLKTKVKPLRTALFNVLCKFEGIEVKHMTKTQVKSINSCVTELRDVSPDLIADEIDKRGAMFIKAHPTWSKDKFTARALVKNWGTLFNGTTLPSKVDEPEGWRERAAEIFPDVEPATVSYYKAQRWSDMGRQLQLGIIRRMQKLTQAQPARDATAEAYFG